MATPAPRGQGAASAESGSFGKSTRRSRSRTGTPARGARENPTLAAADRLFGDWVSNQAAPSLQRQNSSGGNHQQQQQQQQSQGQSPDDAAPQRAPKSQPVEMILRGYRAASQQYAALAHYESLAGAILEDYPRDPPSTQRRYKSELRDPAYTRRRALGPEERALVNRADGGEHWVKVTFWERRGGQRGRLRESAARAGLPGVCRAVPRHPARSGRGVPGRRQPRGGARAVTQHARARRRR